MKYWLFDGKDVLGPFTLQALATRADFSATSLICAGEKGDESDGWQLALSFEEFRFHPTTGQLECVCLLDGKEVPATDIPAQEPQPVSAETVQTDIPPQDSLPEETANALVSPTQAEQIQTRESATPQEIEISAPKAEPELDEEPRTVRLAREDIELILPSHKTDKQTEVAPQQKDTPAKQESPENLQSESPHAQGAQESAESENTPETPQGVQPEEETLPTEQAPQTDTQETQEAPSAEHASAPQEAENTLTVEPEEEIISTCTLPLVNEILEQSDLPQLPKEEFQPVPLPETPGFELKEISADTESLLDTPAESSPTFTEQETAFTASETVPTSSAPMQEPTQGSQPEPVEPPDSAREGQPEPQDVSPATLNEPQELVVPVPTAEVAPQEHPDSKETAAPTPTMEAPRPPREQTLYRLEQALAKHKAAPNILEQKSPTRQTAHVVLWIVFATVILLSMVIWGLTRIKAQTAKKSAQVTKTVATVSKPQQVSPLKPVTVEQPATASVPVASTPVTPKTTEATNPVDKPIAPAPMTAQDRALLAVKNYQLPDNKGTIASYLEQTYQNHLAQGYTASWSVEHLHKSIYIVKYRLTKTRTEPVVYVFHADGARGKLTGALNNIALDLLGRI